MNDIIQHKQEFIDELKALGYKISLLKNDLSQIVIAGSDKSIVCNLKTTRHKRILDDIDEIWYGISENVLNEVDYVILLPLDATTFYIIPIDKLLSNKDLFFNSSKGNYSFHLIFSEERIIGLQNMGYIDLNGNFGILFSMDFQFFNINAPELPFFPKL